MHDIKHSNKYITYSLSAFLLILPLIYFHDLRDASSLPRYAFLGVVSGLFIIFLSFSIVQNKKLIYSASLVPILLFLFLAGLSLLWSLDPKNTLIKLIQQTSLVVICYTFMYISSHKLIHIPFLASIFGASIAASIGIAQYFNFNPFNYHQFIVPASTFTNTNFASNYLDLIVPVSFVFIFIAKTNIQRLLISLASGICLSFIFISHTRGSWLGLSIAFIMFIFLLYKRENLRALLSKKLLVSLPYLLLSLAIALSLFFSSPPDIEQPRKSSQLVLDGSSKIRLNAYINSLSIIKDYPIVGTGYGAFRSAFRNYMFSTVPFTTITEDNILLYLHNDPLQLFVELGILGGFLYLIIYLVVLRTCWKILTSNKDPTLLLITLGVFIALIASGIHSLVDFPLHKPTSAIQLWCWIGFILGISAKKIELNVTSIKFKYIPIVTIFGIVFIAYNIIFYKDYISASQYRLKSENALKKNDCKKAKLYADNMINLFNYDFLHLSLYTAVYSTCPFSDKVKMQAMKKVLDQDPTNTRALITQGTIYLQSNKINKAKTNFFEVARILPHKASGYIGLAYAEVIIGDNSKAKSLLQHALQLEPDNKIGMYLMSKIKND